MFECVHGYIGWNTTGVTHKQNVTSCISQKWKQKCECLRFNLCLLGEVLQLSFIKHLFTQTELSSGSPVDFWVNHKTFLFSLRASLPHFYFTLFIYLFFSTLLCCRLKILLPLVTVPQWPLCVKTMTVFPRSIRHSAKKDVFWDITNVLKWLL